jgi:hypothetical protein
MHPVKNAVLGLAGAVAAVVSLVVFTAVAGARVDSPFSSMSGSWSGSGHVSFDSGKSERLKCRASYNPRGANDLGMSIRCAGAGNAIDLRASLSSSGGRVSGNWEERQYNASGSINGQASANKLSLAISGAIQGSMSVTTSGSSQSVSISTRAGGMTGVNIGLSRD